MKTRLSKVLACLFASILTATAEDYSVFAAQTSTLEYYVCPNSKMLKEDETDYSEMSKGGTLRFSAAANERESGQIILTGSGTQTITLALNGDLSDRKGHSIPKKNFEIYFEHYVYEREFDAIIDYGSYPDALIPYELAINENVGANKIEFGSEKEYRYYVSKYNADKGKNEYKPIDETVTKKNQGIWFTLTVPQGTPAGIYTGTLTGSLNVDVEVQVYDFELPDKTQSVEWLDVHAAPSCKNSIQSTTGIGIDSNNANILYLDEMNSFLDKRKISSGHSGVVFDNLGLSDLEDYVNGIYDHVNTSRSRYYNITVDNWYTEAPIDLDDNTKFYEVLEESLQSNTKIDDTIDGLRNALQEQICKRFQANGDTILGILKNEDNDEELNEVLKLFLSQYQKKMKETPDCKKNSPWDYKKYVRNTLTETMRANQGGPTVPFYCYLYSTLSVISKHDYYKWGNTKKYAGVISIMNKIVDKSNETGIDLLQYAFLKIPYVDEPCAWQITDNLQTLLNASVLEECKDEVKDHIVKNVGNKGMKESLLKSLDNCMMLFTTTPTNLDEGVVVAHDNNKENVYTAIQYKGLSKLRERDNWKQLKLLLSHNYIKDSSGSFYFKTKYWDPYNEDDIIIIDDDFINRYYCPLFTDFSYSTRAKAQDIDTTRNALKNSIPMWWYSCTSIRNAGNAGFRLNQNRGEIDNSGTSIYMNPLAVKRANKWQQFQMGIIGEHFWAVDDAFGATEPGNPNRNVSQWGKIGNENLLVYPIKQYLKNVCGLNDEKYESKLNQIANEYGYFMSTLRLENEAEANDDYDYLCLAKQLAENYPEYQDKINRIIQLIIEPGNVDYTDKNRTNSTNLMLARTQLAALIEGRISNAKVITNEKENDYIKLSDYGIGNGIQNWKNSNKALCFDVFKIDGLKSGKASIVLVDNAWKSLSDVIWIDFSSKSLVDKGNGWYQVVLPLGNAPANRDKDPNGKGTLCKLYFDSRNVTSPILVDNFKVVTEISGTLFNDYIKLSDYGIGNGIQNWKNSNKALCFDVIKTDYQKEGCSETAKIILTNEQGSPLSDSLQLDFKYNVIYLGNKKLDDALFVKKDNGWYQVILPLNAVPEKNSGGGKTLYKVYFNQQDVYRSFVVDNFKVLANMKTASIDNYVKLSDYGIQSISNWKSSNKSLCFDVFNKKQQGTASIVLINSGWDGLSDVLKIDFSAKTITKYYGDDKIGALLVDKGKGRYQVILPLNNVPEYNNGGEKELCKLYFAPNNISVPFLIVDNVRLKMT